MRRTASSPILAELVPAVQALGHEVFVVTANVAGPTDGCQVFRVERTGANGPFGRHLEPCAKSLGPELRGLPGRRRPNVGRLQDARRTGRHRHHRNGRNLRMVPKGDKRCPRARGREDAWTILHEGQYDRPAGRRPQCVQKQARRARPQGGLAPLPPRREHMLDVAFRLFRPVRTSTKRPFQIRSPPANEADIWSTRDV